MARVTLGKKRMLNERSAFVVAKSTRTYFVRTLLPQVGLEKMKVNTEPIGGGAISELYKALLQRQHNPTVLIRAVTK